MPRNLLVFITSISAPALAFATAASAADYRVGVEQGYAVEQESGYAVGVEERVAVVEEDDSLVDIDINLFDDDDEEARVISSYEAVPYEAAPY
jgi:hypothetical protein